MDCYEIYYLGNVIFSTIAESEQSAVLDFVTTAESMGIKLVLYPLGQYEVVIDGKMRIFYIHNDRLLGYVPTWSYK